MDIKGRNFLKLLDFTPEEINGLVELAARLKADKKAGREKQMLKGKNIVLLFEKDSTRTRCAFEVGAYDQGAQVTYLGPTGSQMGKKVLLVDADPQANATSGLGFDINNRGIYECITGECGAADVIIGSPDVKHLSVLPSSIDLVGADAELPGLEDGHLRMKKSLDAVKAEYDFIFIDCSPSLGYTTVNALVAADSVLIPVQCEYFALEGLGKLLSTIKMTKSRLNPGLEIEGFVMTMYSRSRLANQVTLEVREHFKHLAYDTIIQRNIRLSEAPSHGKPVILHDAASTGSAAYMNLAKEFMQRNRKQ